MSRKSFEPASFECDRRLCRAARELLKRRVIPLLPRNTQDDSADTVLRQSIINASTCIFHPDRDVLRQDEQNSKRIPAGLHRSSPRKKAPHWYECGYCGSTFLTKYYLDLHLETSHRHSQASGDEICPAESYCQVLGGCDHVALELEPYYGRGSGGIGPDAFQVRQIWSRRLQPCNEVILQQEIQPACRHVMKQCFVPQVADDLIVGVCDTITCHNRLLQLAGHVVRHVHTWKSVWDQHHNHSVGWLGIVVVMLLLAFYFVLYVQRRPMQPTNRLLSKKATPSKWKMFGSSPTKKKLH